MSFLNCTIEGCYNPVENRDTGLCASHVAEQRKAYKAKKKIKVVHQPNKVSEKRADELKEYPITKKKFLEFKDICELRFKVCTKKSTQIHHCSKSALNFLNEKTWKAACDSCHKYLETDISAEQRREMGLLTD